MRSLLSPRSARGSRRTPADSDLGRHPSSATNATSNTSFSLGPNPPTPPPASEDEDDPYPPEHPEDEDDASDDSDILSETLALQRRRRSASHHVPTLSPYVDARPTIKTYFKIYSPSRGGRMLSVYESAPDKFNFSQSWGWKSSTLMLDEGILGDDDAGVGGAAGKGDGKLRFMVVIGNI